MKDDKAARTALVIFAGGIVGLVLGNTSAGKSAAERTETWVRANVTRATKVLTVENITTWLRAKVTRATEFLEELSKLPEVVLEMHEARDNI